MLFNDRTSWCLIFPLACKCLKFIDPHFFSSQREEKRFSRTWNNLETCHFGLLGLHFCGGVDYKILTLVSFYFGRKPIWANPMSTLAGTECGLWRSKRLSGGLETVGIVLSIAICANVSKWESQGLDIITHTLSELFHHMNHLHCDISCSFWKVFFWLPDYLTWRQKNVLQTSLRRMFYFQWMDLYLSPSPSWNYSQLHHKAKERNHINDIMMTFDFRQDQDWSHFFGHRLKISGWIVETKESVIDLASIASSPETPTGETR